LELDDAKLTSSKEDEAEDEETHTRVLRRSMRERRQRKRYSPLDFHSNFSLSINDDDPKMTREAVK
jgi:hypothetical protein